MWNRWRYLFWVGAVLSVFLTGCSDNDSTNQNQIPVQKSSEYYRVLSMLGIGGNDLFMGTQEGLMLGELLQGDVTTLQRYTDTSDPPIGNNVVRGVARNPARIFLAMATNRGLTIGRLTGGDQITSTAVMTKASNPELGRTENFQDVLFIGDTVIATVYHLGVVIGRVQEDGTVPRFKIYSRDTTPGLVTRAVKSLAVNNQDDTVLIGSIGGGLAVASYNAQSQAFSAIMNVGKDVIGHQTVDDIAVNRINGLVALGTRTGLAMARFDGSEITFLRNYNENELGIPQCHRVAFSHDGKRIAMGNHDTVLVGDVDENGTLQNLVVYASDRVLSLIFSDNDTYLLIGTNSGQSNKIVSIRL